MTLANTTSGQDRVLEPLESLLSLDTAAIMSVIEDLDQRLSVANSQFEDIEGSYHNATAELKQLEAELEQIKAEHAELQLQHDKLQRHAAVLEAELSDNAEQSSDSQKNN